MRSLEIISAVHNEEHGYIVVAKQITNDDGSIEFAGHSFYPESVEWIGAVYDTKDMDEIIDLILYEPYVDNIDPMLMTATEAKIKHKNLINTFKAVKKDKTFKKSDAIQAIRDSEIPNEFADAALDNPYDVIKELCPIDDDLFEAKKEHANRVRQQRKQNAKKILTKEQKLSALRERKNPRSGTPETKKPELRKLEPVLLEKGRRRKK